MRCGSLEDLRINIKYDEKEMIVQNLPWSERTSCVWNFWDKYDGFAKYGGEVIKIRVNEIANMDVVIAYGEKSKFAVRHSTSAE